MSVESKPNKLVKGLVLDTFHTDVDNTVATYALNSQLEDQEGNHFHYGSEVGTTYIKEIPTNHVVIGHINMERNETVLFTTDGTNSTIGILSRNDDMSYNYEIKVDDTKQEKKLNFKKDTYIRGVYRLLNGCDKVIYFVDGINKDRRININKLDSYKTSDTTSVASGIIFDDSLRATIYALSSVTGNIQLIRLMSANPEATANVLATLTSGAELTKLLTASANGIGTAFANLMRTANIISSVEATGTTTSNVDIVRLLQGNVTAIGSVNAILESVQQGLVEIDVTLTGVASSTAIILRAALLETNITTEATTVVDAILTRIINAQVQALADTSSIAQISIPINATVDATATTAADALLSYAINATANAMAQTSATVQLSQVINASVDALADSFSEALIGLVLVSTTNATGSISTANLFINRLLTSSVTAEGTTTVEALIAKLLDSSVTAQSDTTTDLLVSKLLESTVNGIGSVTANLQIADLLSSTITGTATTQALLEAITAIVSDPYIDNVSLLLQGDNNPTGVTQNNTFIDSSTNNFTITRNGNVTQGTFSPFDKAITNSGGSAYFDGTGDNLTLPDNDAWHFGSGNFTVESWVYITSSNAQQTIAGQWDGIGGGNLSWILFISNDSNRYLRFAVSSTGSNVVFDLVSTSTIPLNQWSHIAIVRNGNVFQLYLNGIAATGGSTTNSVTLFNTTNVLTVGATSLNTQNFFGYISNLRIVKGTALYTSNFQPSTTPLTAITNTSLLLNFNNAAIFDGVKNNNIETVGIASITTTPSLTKFGNGAIAINGSSSSSDYITVPSNTIHNLGSDSFTIEFWLYVVSNPTIAAGLITRASYSGNTGYSIILYPGYVGFIIGNILYVQTPASSISTLTWTHIAFVRSGTSGRFFINGTQSGSTGTINNFTDASTPLAIGALNTATGWNANLTLTGVMDDIRITKGIARYTSSPFTPPSKLPSLIPNYLINRSLRFSAARQTSLNRTPTVAGNRKTWTWSGWVKRGALNVDTTILGTSDTNPSNNANVFALRFLNTNVIRITQISADGSSSLIQYDTNAVFRDISTWYHIVLALDTTQATNSNGLKLYVNNILQTGTYTNYTQNYDTSVNSISYAMYLGRYSSTAPTSYFDGYMAEVNFIDGQALTPTSFGELDLNLGTWIPKLYTGTYGTNGFRLKFSDLTQLGEDFSGNLNNWTPTNFTTTPGADYDLINDTPINADDTIGNYATLNPLTISNGTLNNGNLNWIPNGNNSSVWSTIAVNTGKWYFEYVYTSGNNMLSISQEPRFNSFSTTDGITKLSINMYLTGSSNNFIYNSVVVQSFPAGWGTTISGDVIGVLIDFTTGIITIRRNNDTTNQVNYTMSSVLYSQPIHFGYSVTTTWSAGNFSWNFGQRPFAYTIPTGFKALNTFNLPTPTIGATAATQANKFMDISLYTGTGAAQSIFNSGAFQPDLVWIKNRTGTASNHALYDSVRGVTKQLSSNLDALETTEATGLTAFNSNGFTIGALGQINTSGSNYIAWQWRASGTTVANTAGTIASTVSVNTTAGFSIVSYTGNGNAGATIGHGLNNIPKLIIIKVRTGVAANWIVYHDSFGLSFGNIPALFLNNSSTEVGSITYWNNTRPTNNLITLGTDSGVNANTRNYIAYVWAEIDGFSKFNSYVGNGSTDGTFVYTGFRPKFILIRKYNSSGDWVLYNSIVNTSNPVSNELLANSTLNENTTDNDLDFLSNGFKLRSANANINTSSTTYIYGAFAEFPLKYANAALTERVKETIQVDYLVVAGGGGGAASRTNWGTGGGGGGGQVLSGSLTLNKSTDILVTVGTGGNGGATENAVGANGNDSKFSTITALKGNGAGQALINSSLGTGGNGGASGSGNAGGTGGWANSANTNAGGGGGGQSSVGNNRSTNTGGNGGSGLSSSIAGYTLTYGGGGGGAGSVTKGNGVDGGANGAQGDNNGIAAVDNRGGGGGGACQNIDGSATKTGGKGGSGIVIISYPETNGNVVIPSGLYYKNSSGNKIQGTGVSVNPTNTTGGNKIYEFLEGSGNIQLS